MRQLSLERKRTIGVHHDAGNLVDPGKAANLQRHRVHATHPGANFGGTIRTPTTLERNAADDRVLPMRLQLRGR
jgi:hypothetical protein